MRHIPLLLLTILSLAACQPRAPLPTPVAPLPTAAAWALPSPTLALPTPLATATPSPTAKATTVAAMAAPEEVRPTNTPLPTPIIYTVAEGDTLSTLSVRFDVDLPTLLTVNGLTMDSLVYPGDTLIIPPGLANAAPDLPIHYVQPGETLSAIAAQYGVATDALAAANPSVTPEQLPIGQPLRIPLGLGEVHYVLPGQTLSYISWVYDVSLDDLLKENLDILSPDDPDYVPAGVLLKLPATNVTAEYDCSPGPARQTVLTHTIANGEKLFCLGRKFNLSITTLLYANPHLIGLGAIQDGVEIVVPPADGALYELSTVDVAGGLRLEHLMAWYGINRIDQVTYWDGRQAFEPFEAGQRLFIWGGDLLAGPFDAYAVLALAPPPLPTAVAGTGNTAPPGQPQATPLPAPPVAGHPAPPVGNPPPGAMRPANNPWVGELSEFDTGYCGPVPDGHGWNGTLRWPADRHVVDEDRHFRPGHTGIDISLATGSPVYAAAPGVVVWSGFSSWGGGVLVVIAHGGTWRSYYGHLSQAVAPCGATVGAGQLVGYSGQSGMASWPHLHFEIRQNGFSYDPLRWLK